MGIFRSIPLAKVSEELGFLYEVNFADLATKLARVQSDSTNPSAEKLAAKALTMPGNAGDDVPIDTLRMQFPRIVGMKEQLDKLRIELASTGISNVWVYGPKESGKTTVVEALIRSRAERRLSSQLGSKPFFIFDAMTFFTQTPQDQWMTKFNQALDTIASRNGFLIVDHFDDFVLMAGNESERLVNSMISKLEHNNQLQALIISESENVKLINEASTGIARRFKTLPCTKQPSFEEMKPILMATFAKLERAHNLRYTEEAADEIIRLLSRYPGRAFTDARPGNAIAFADMVGAYVRLNKYAEPPEVTEMREKLGVMRDQCEILGDDPKTKGRCLGLQAEIAVLTEKYEKAEGAWKDKFQPLFKAQQALAEVDQGLTELRDKKDRTDAENKKFNIYSDALPGARAAVEKAEQQVYPEPPLVRAADVRRVFNMESGLAIRSEQERLERLERIKAYLRTQIFNQEEAVDTLANIYIGREMGVNDPSRPAGVVIFAGGTGLGKTEEVRAITRFDLGVEDRPDLADAVEPISVNMNDYTTSASVSSLTGAARGLVGYDEAIPWLEQVKSNPRGPVMFDEIDKAHPTINKALMQVLDTGRLTDSHGQNFNFKDAIIVINMNGLTVDDFENPEQIKDKALVRQKLLEIKSQSPEARDQKLFAPEFVGRVDAVVVFNKLRQEDLIRIFRDQQLRRINQDYKEKGISVEADDETIKAILDKYNAPAQGGRGPRQVVNSYVRPIITEYLTEKIKAAVAAGTVEEEAVKEHLRLTFDGEKVGLESMDDASPVRAAPLMRQTVPMAPVAA